MCKISKLTTLLIFAVLGLQISAQDYTLDFKPSNLNARTDSIKVENVTQGTTLMLDGNSYLRLASNFSSIQTVNNKNTSLKAYPNPMIKSSTVDFYNPSSGNIIIEIFSLDGKRIVSFNQFLEQGDSKCEISGLNNGSYILSILTRSNRSSVLLVSSATDKNVASINLSRLNSIGGNNLQKKSTETNTVNMYYSTGNVMRFTAYLYNNTSIKDLIPLKTETLNFNYFDFKKVLDDFEIGMDKLIVHETNGYADSLNLNGSDILSAPEGNNYIHYTQDSSNITNKFNSLPMCYFLYDEGNDDNGWINSIDLDAFRDPVLHFYYNNNNSSTYLQIQSQVEGIIQRLYTERYPTIPSDEWQLICYRLNTCEWYPSYDPENSGSIIDPRLYENLRINFKPDWDDQTEVNLDYVFISEGAISGAKDLTNYSMSSTLNPDGDPPPVVP